MKTTINAEHILREYRSAKAPLMTANMQYSKKIEQIEKYILESLGLKLNEIHEIFNYQGVKLTDFVLGKVKAEFFDADTFLVAVFGRNVYKNGNMGRPERYVIYGTLDCNSIKLKDEKTGGNKATTPQLDFEGQD